MLMHLTPYWESKYAKEINMTKKLYAQSLLDDGETDPWEKHISTKSSARAGDVVESEVVEDRQEQVATVDDDDDKGHEHKPEPPSVTMF